jgi:putative flippase GtrA
MDLNNYQKLMIRQAVLFIFATGIGFGINIGLTAFLHELLGISPGISFAVALACAYIVNFFNNRKWVFSSDAEVFPQTVRFLAVSLGFRLAEYLVFLLLYGALGLHYLAAVLISLFSFYFLKFFVYKEVVFTSKGKPADNF